MIEVLRGSIIKEVDIFLNRKVSILFTILNSFLLFTALYFLFNNIIETDSTSRIIFIVSYLFWYFSLSVITEPGWIVSNESARGTIEQWFLSPHPLWYILFTKIIAANFVNLIRTISLLILIMVTTGINILTSPKIFIIIFIALVGMYGLGFFLAGISLLYKRIQDVLPLFQYLILVIIALPYSDDQIAKFLPIYSGSNLLKGTLANITLTSYDYIIFLLSSLFFLTLGVMFFIWCENKVKKSGTIGRL